jgi:hypothetical protein
MSTLIVKKYTRTRRASKLYGGRGEGREEEGDVETGGRLDDTLNTVRGRERTSECKLSMAQLKGLAHTIKPQLGVGRSNGNYRAGLNKRVTAISNASFHQDTTALQTKRLQLRDIHIRRKLSLENALGIDCTPPNHVHCHRSIVQRRRSHLLAYPSLLTVAGEQDMADAFSTKSDVPCSRPCLESQTFENLA